MNLFKKFIMLFVIFSIGCVQHKVIIAEKDKQLRNVSDFENNVLSLKAQTKTKFTNAKQSDSFAQNYYIIYPDKVRIETADFFGSVVSVFLMDGGSLFFLDYKTKDIYVGSASKENIARLINIDFPPEFMINILLAKPIQGLNNEIFVKYEDYEEIEGIYFPKRINIESVKEDMKIEINYKKLFLNGNIEKEIFSIKDITAFKIINLR